MKKKSLSFLALIVFLGLTPATSFASQAEVRSTVQSVFEQLKSHNYNALYDLLPSSSRGRMSRERFVSALQRAQGFYELDRMDVGAIKESGNLAVVDTVLYGRIVNPIQAEGKIVAQQYLIKEEGKWRVATGDQSTVKKFLASNPAFGKGFKIRDPRIYIKQNDKWVEFNGPRTQRKQA
ncbi:MAG TPA: hypothetical protein VFY51_07785 [Pyrinomonadaceae bacterium]|nr:hypothetical protein [Pyrinomonadaceae bacterium]